MGDPEKKDGGEGGSGGDGSPAPGSKTTDERFTAMEERQKKNDALLQSTQEELKRVSNLNAVLMQKLSSGGSKGGDGEGGMTANNTTPIKLKRDFSQMDPASDPARFATELVLETAEQVSQVIARNQYESSQRESLRNSFYANNKDLVGWERIVGTFSDEVQRDNPGMTFDQAAVEIAKRARDFIKSKGVETPQGDDIPPHALPPGKGGNDIHIKPPKGGGGEAYNPDKAYEEDMKEYANMRGKERDRSLVK